MNEKVMTNEDEVALKAITEFAKGCYSRGVRDAVICVTTGFVLTLIADASVTFVKKRIEEKKERKKLEKK